MRIGIISTRLSGTDGVSLEVEKWSQVLRRMGHELFYCAGQLDGYAAGGMLISKLHFSHHTIYALTQRAFEQKEDGDTEKLIDEIYSMADELRAPLRSFIRGNKLDMIIVQNALTIPMNLPLGIALTGLIAELGIDTIAHHHDFYWERQRYQANQLMDMLDTTFPAKLPSIQHVTINSIARDRLKARRGIDSVIVPNVCDFSSAPPNIDQYNNDFRDSLGLRKDDLFILQPTRVIQRKGIELSIMLVNRLNLPKSHLYITHSATDEGKDYWLWLMRESRVMGVDLQLIEHFIGSKRMKKDGLKKYTLWDVYPHVDLVTYPSIYEGFGNALLEAVYFKRPMVVNRYPVYNADIRPLGFKFVELNGFVDEHAVDETMQFLQTKDEVEKICELNYAIAREHFSFEVLEFKLNEIIKNFR